MRVKTKNPMTATPPAIDARNLTRSFGTRKALDSLTFKLPADSFLSVFGPNGAGKSTLLSILSTLKKPSDGSASILGYDLKEQAEELRRHIGVISHRSMLFPDLTAYENLMFYADLHCINNAQTRVEELLEMVELTARKHDRIRGFSRGMTQRVAIARALLNDPELLFLDEPYSGLDPRATSILTQLITEIRVGKSMVLVSHDLEQGLQLATHVMVLSQGKLVLFEERDSLQEQGFAETFREVTESF